MKLKKFFVSGRHDTLPFDRQKKQHFTWGFDVQAGGKRYQERGYLTKQHAEEVVAKIKADAKNQRHDMPTPVTVPYLIELLQWKLDTMSGPDRGRAKRVFRVFLGLLPANIKVTDLRSRDFQTYIENRKAENVTAATIRRELVPLISTLNKARHFSPALETYRPPVVDRPQVDRTVKDKTINLSEQGLILHHLSHPKRLGESRHFAEIRMQTADLLQFLLLTAARVGEVAKLKKSDVDLFSNRVRIVHTKTAKKKNPIAHLPITPTMAAILQRRFALTENEYLFTPNGKVTPGMRRALKEACELHGMKFGKNEFDGISFNRTRHTSTTDLVRSNADLKTIGEFTGHSDQKMTMHYAHANQADIEKAAAVLEANRGGDYTKKDAFFDADGEKVTSFSN